MTFFFFFKQKTAYEILSGLVGSEMCIRDRDTPPVPPDPTGGDPNGGHHPSDPLGALPVVGAVLDGAQEGPAISPGGDKPRSSGDKDEVVATVLGKRDAPDGDGDE